MYLLSFVLVLMTVFASLSFSLVEQLQKVYPFTQEVLKRKQHFLTFCQLMQAESCYQKHKCPKELSVDAKEEEKEHFRSSARAFIPLHIFACQEENSVPIKKILLNWMEEQFLSQDFIPHQKKEQVFEQFVEEFQKLLQDLHQKEILERENIAQLKFSQEEHEKLFHYLWQGVETENGLILPLKDFITLQGDGSIRLWLAPSAVLSAFVGDETAQSIVSLRKDLYKKLRQGLIDQGDCSKLFSEQINVDSELFDFSSSSSNPEMYEPRSI